MAKHDWDKWRRVYVVGDDTVTLPSIAAIPGAPSLPSLKRVSASELWADQRKRYRTERDTVAAVSVANRVEQIIDAAEMLAQHASAARLLRQKALEAIERIGVEALKPADAIAWLKLAIEIERLTEGLATERQAVTHDGGLKIEITRRIIDPTGR